MQDVINFGREFITSPWVLVVLVPLIFLYWQHWLAVSRRKHELRGEDEAGRKKAEAEQRRRKEEIEDRLRDIKAAKHNQFVTAINAVIDRLDGRKDPRAVCADRFQNLSFTVGQFAEILSGTKRADFDNAWNQYCQLQNNIPTFGLTRKHRLASNTLDYSEGIAFIMPALVRLRSFSEDASHLLS